MHKHFQQFDPWGVSRWVWMSGPGEAPASAGEAPPPPPPPEGAAAAPAAVVAQEVAVAGPAPAPATEPEAPTAAANAKVEAAKIAVTKLANLVNGLDDSEATDALPALGELLKAIENIEKGIDALFKASTVDGVFDKEKFAQSLQQFLESDEQKENVKKIIAFESAVRSIQPEQAAKYLNADGTINTDLLTQTFTTISAEKPDDAAQEIAIMMAVVGNQKINETVDFTSDPYGGILAKQGRERLDVRRNTAEINRILTQDGVKDKYEAYKAKPSDDTEKALLASITNEKEQGIIRAALESNITPVEQSVLHQDKFKGEKPTEETIKALLAKGELNPREVRVAAAILEAAKTETADAKKPDKKPEEEGLSILDLFEKLGSKLMALVEYIGIELKKWNDKKEQELIRQRFKNSPIKGQEKLVLKGTPPFKKGEGVVIDAPKDADVVSVADGKVTKVDGGNVELTLADKRKVVFKNVAPGSTTVVGKDLKAGETIGKVKDGNGLGLQIFKESGVETEPWTAINHLLPTEQAGAAPAAAETAPLPTFTDEVITKNWPQDETATFDATTKRGFKLPYKEGEADMELPCELTKDGLKVGETIYNMKLENTETAVSVLKANKDNVTFKGTAEISILPKELFGIAAALQKNPDSPVTVKGIVFAKNAPATVAAVAPALPAAAPPPTIVAAPAAAPAPVPPPPRAEPAPVDIAAEAAALKARYMDAIEVNLAKYQNKGPVDPRVTELEFKLPYIEGTAIQDAPCSIKGNTFKVGNNTYTLELPGSAELQSIEITGPVESGTTQLVAGKLFFSDSKEIPLADLLQHLQKLRTHTEETYPITLDGQTVTFRKK